MQEAWIEKGFYNNPLKNGSIAREAENWCQLCFTIKQTPGSKFLLEDVLSWSMREVVSKKGVSVRIEKSYSGIKGVYVFSMFEKGNCTIPDSIAFNLTIDSDRKRTQLGKLVFKSKLE